MTTYLFELGKGIDQKIEITEDFRFEVGMELLIKGEKVKVIEVVFGIGSANLTKSSVTTQNVYYEKTKE